MYLLLYGNLLHKVDLHVKGRVHINFCVQKLHASRQPHDNTTCQKEIKMKIFGVDGETPCEYYYIRYVGR